MTSGANFGFGYWNGGGSYYGGWQGNHPAGRSRICNKDACLQVGIGPEGAANAIQYLGNLNVDGRTDANAWSQLAHDYFDHGEKYHHKNNREPIGTKH